LVLCEPWNIEYDAEQGVLATVKLLWLLDARVSLIRAKEREKATSDEYKQRN
jgi:hypothetical protein